MPETSLTVRWPDGQTRSYYSPSTCVHTHFSPGDTHTVDSFLRASRLAWNEASDRVAAKFGFACTGAASSLAEIEAHGAEHPADGEVVIVDPAEAHQNASG